MAQSLRGKILSIVMVAGLTAIGAVAQSTGPLQFDAATIRINKGPGMGQGAESVSIANGRLSIVNIPLRMLTRLAFLGIRDSRPIIDPDALDKVRVDVIGKAASPDASTDDLRAMVQSLLKERMQLVSHFEEREMPAYALTLSGNASKLIETSGAPGRCESKRSSPPALPLNQSPDRPPNGASNGQFNHMDCHVVSMADFARQLSTMVDRPVIERTSLAGNRSFSFDYEIQRDAPAGTFSEPLREIGLRLVPQKLPVPVLIVDSIASRPVE